MQDIISSANFEELYAQHANTLLNIAISKVGDKDVAMDLVQDLFVDLWQRKGHVNIRSNVQNYLISALYRKVFLHFRKSGLSQKHLDHYTVLQSLQGELEGFDQANAFEHAYSGMMEQIDHSVDQMPSRMRAVFELKYYKSYSNQQIADMLEISNQTVKNQLTNSLDYLRKEMTGKHVQETLFMLPVVAFILQN